MRKLVRGLIEAEEGWQVCGEAVDGRHATEQATLLKPDLIVLDVQMPVMDGFAATREILIRSPHMIILILSIGEAVHFSRVAADSGTKGYPSKSHAAQSLIEVIAALLGNGTHFAHAAS
jgi:DNA-binding NarL/FixJ family response regulator